MIERAKKKEDGVHKRMTRCTRETWLVQDKKDSVYKRKKMVCTRERRWCIQKKDDGVYKKKKMGVYNSEQEESK